MAKRHTNAPRASTPRGTVPQRGTHPRRGGSLGRAPLAPQGCAAPYGGCAGRGVRLQGPGLRTPRATGVRSPPLGGVSVDGWTGLRTPEASGVRTPLVGGTPTRNTANIAPHPSHQACAPPPRPASPSAPLAGARAPPCPPPLNPTLSHSLSLSLTLSRACCASRGRRARRPGRAEPPWAPRGGSTDEGGAPPGAGGWAHRLWGWAARDDALAGGGAEKAAAAAAPSLTHARTHTHTHTHGCPRARGDGRTRPWSCGGGPGGDRATPARAGLTRACLADTTRSRAACHPDLLAPTWSQTQGAAAAAEEGASPPSTLARAGCRHARARPVKSRDRAVALSPPAARPAPLE